MKRFQLFALSAVLAFLSVVTFISAPGCAHSPGQGLRQQVEGIAAPYAFNLVSWEAGALLDRVWPDCGGSVSTALPDETVIRYFVLAREKRVLLSQQGNNLDAAARVTAIENEQNRLAPVVSAIIEKQVHEALSGLGITNPFILLDRLNIVFPPVALRLEQPPRLLIISPRERIHYLQRITLRPSITSQERESIEKDCDSLGVSSLVEDLGGLATYPSIVSGDANLLFVLETAAEEWVHQYLAFRPLGLRYVLDITGLRPDQEIITMNETLAGIVSEEVAEIIVRNHYAKYLESPPAAAPRIDFNREMRATRIKTDELLARGEIDEAERYMEERRQFLVANGYYIRKLNQAYFAFHGTYAYHPGSVSPIYRDLQQLRAGSVSLKEFLDRVSTMTGYNDLKMALVDNR